jgi:nicotinamide mononucleotide transporter
MEVLIEIFAVLFGFVYVLLAILENRVCWIFGFFSSFIFLFIFYQSEIYMQALLQIFYCFVAVYGWLNWGSQSNPLAITRIGILKSIFYFLFAASLFFVIYSLIRDLGIALIPIDLFISILAITATYLASEKKIENWFFWIIVDLLTIYLLVSQGLFVSSLMYVIYFFMSVIGLLKWHKNLKAI